MPWVRSRRAFAASASSLVVTRPASPNAPRFLLGKNEKQRIGARRHGNRVTDGEPRGELVLETVDFRADDEPLAVADAGDRGENRVAQRPILRLEIEQGNGHRVVILAVGSPEGLRYLLPE